MRSPRSELVWAGGLAPSLAWKVSTRAETPGSHGRAHVQTKNSSEASKPAVGDMWSRRSRGHTGLGKTFISDDCPRVLPREPAVTRPGPCGLRCEHDCTCTLIPGGYTFAGN